VIPAFSFIGALFVTMVLLPPLMRLAGPLHLLDVPNERKIHTDLVPRCGGLAIASGILLPILMWLPLEGPMVGLLSGGLIVFLFGLWDDVKDLNYKIKLLGQVIALAVVMQSGIVLEHLPLAGLDAMPVWVSFPLTALFILGITNAVNLSDGLDGLAAGCTMITLAIIALLAYQANGFPVVVLCLSVMGGILGFLRYNTHPAIVFLGDAGSQFLGFVAATTTIFLVERVNSALSPALPLLLLGFPILDTSWAVVRRLLGGRSPFKPDRGHIHHKLLALGFKHYEAVSLIYVMHGFLICTTFYVRYQSDILILGIFFVFCIAVVGLVSLAERRGWQVHRAVAATAGPRRFGMLGWRWLPLGSTYFLGASVAVFLVIGASVVRLVPHDIVVVSVAAIAVLVAGTVLMPGRRRLMIRAGIYMSSVLVVFLLVPLPPNLWFTDFGINVYLAVSSVVLIVAMRVARRDMFRVTPQDLLIVFFALVVPNLSSDYLSRFPLNEMVFRLLVLFYITEFLMNRHLDESLPTVGGGILVRFINWLLRISSVCCLAILAAKGYF
jgi:UDP-GlcNAc:undecaprenyl-phosphate GlcNAc-1-phosphate transferase